MLNSFGVRPTPTANYVSSSGSVLGAIALPSGCSGTFTGTSYPSTVAGVQVNNVIGPYATYIVAMLGLSQLKVTATGTATFSSNPAIGSYAMYSASTNCGTKDIDWSSGTATVNSNVHANSGMTISGTSNNIAVGGTLSTGSSSCGGFTNGSTSSGGIDMAN